MTTILDHTGQPIDMAALREPQTARVGWVQREFDAHPAKGLTPRRLANILLDGEQGHIADQLDLAEDIEERDGHVFAELDKRSGAVSLLDWSLEEPDGADAKEKAQTAQLSEWLHACVDMPTLVNEMMGAVLRGFCCNEMVWSVQPDGSRRQVLMPKVTWRPQRWFTVDRETRNELRLRTQAGDGEALKPSCWIAHRHRTRNGYLARMGLARVLAWPYLFKHYALRDLAEFLEIYGLPLRLGTYPSGAGDEEKRRLLQAVTQIGHNAAGIVPSGMKIDFQSAADGKEGPFDSMQDRMEAIQSKVILGQTLSGGEGKHGTQALGKVHEGVRMDIRDSDVRQIEATLTAQLLRPLALLNIAGADPMRLPKVKLDNTEAEDMQTFAETLPKLASAGIKIPVKWAQDKLRIPEPVGGEEVMRGAQPAVMPGQPAAAPAGNLARDQPPANDEGKAAAAKKAALAAELQTGEARDGIDDLVDEALRDWQPMLEPLAQPLMAELDRAIAAGESLQDFRARLPQLMDRMDYHPLGERLARAAFTANLAGQADLELDPNAQRS